MADDAAVGRTGGANFARAAAWIVFAEQPALDGKPEQALTAFL
jgi:hypothetical protein